MQFDLTPAQAKIFASVRRLRLLGCRSPQTRGFYLNPAI